MARAVRSRSSSRALSRPAWLRAPETALRLVLGEMAQELFLNGVRAVPERLARLGFSFRFPTLNAALADVLGGLDAVHA